MSTLTPEEIVHRIGLPITQDADGHGRCPVCNWRAGSPTTMVGPHLASHWREAGVDIHSRFAARGDQVIECPIDGCSRRFARRQLKGHLARPSVGKRASGHGIDLAVAGGMARIAHFDLDEYRARTGETPNHNIVTTKRRKRVRLLGCPVGDCSFEGKGKNGLGLHLQRTHGIGDVSEREHLYALAERDERSPGHALAVVEAQVEPVVESMISATDAALAVIMSQANGSIPTGLMPRIVHWIDDTRELVGQLRSGTA